MSRIKFIVIVTVLIDIIGVGIVVPTLPFYVTGIGLRPIVVTLLFTVYSFFSFFSAPFLGALSDRIGRRPVLIISILSTAAGWFIFAAAKSWVFLFVGRIVDGLAAGNISTAQSCLVDISHNDKERSINLGLIGAMFGIGFIVGPFIGGLLGHLGITAPFWFAGGMALLNAIGAVFMLPETHPNRSNLPRMQLNPFLPIVRALRNKVLLPAYVVWFLFGLGVASVNSVFALYLNMKFGFDELVAGFFLGGVGMIVALNQGVALKHFWLKRFKEPQLELFMLGLYAIGYFLMSFSILAAFIVGLAATAFCQSVLRVVLTSQAVGSAEPTKKGEVLGILMSIMSLSMIIAPAVSGYAFERKINAPFWIGGGYMVLAFLIAYYNRRRMAKLTVSEDLRTNTIALE